MNPANTRPGMPGAVGLWSIFLAFLLIGATSVGGGVIAYLRNSLVDKHGWIDDPTFVRMLSISQSLPGLNATNMAILAGDRLRGTLGSVVATVAKVNRTLWPQQSHKSSKSTFQKPSLWPTWLTRCR